MAEAIRSTLAVNNPALGQVIRCNFDSDSVAGNDPDEVLAHLSGDMGQNFVTVFQFHHKLGIWQGFDNPAFGSHWLFFCHTNLLEKSFFRWCVNPLVRPPSAYIYFNYMGKYAAGTAQGWGEKWTPGNDPESWGLKNPITDVRLFESVRSNEQVSTVIGESRQVPLD